MAEQKRWLTPQEQVQHLLSKGVQFDLWAEEDAEEYLRRNNSYFRLRSYRSNFAKRVGGKKDGQYIDLDFAMLVDLSIIDMYLRNELLPLTLDIEHFSKMALLGEIERYGEDGYEIIKDFLASCERSEGNRRWNVALDEISRGKYSPYTKGLVERHPENDYPVWEFFEVIPFGRFAYFVKFCSRRFEDRNLESLFYLLQSVKGLRNACAHNNCIINDMKAGDSTHKPRASVLRALGGIGIGKAARQTKMSNERFQQIATTMYLHRHLASEGVIEHRAEHLERFVERMAKHRDYYAPGSLVSTGFAFIGAMVSGWYFGLNGDSKKIFE